MTSTPRHSSVSRAGLREWLTEADRIDRSLYLTLATTPTPRLDQAMRALSRAADYSRLSLVSAALLALVGGARGQHAAASGLASVAATATVVNVALKPLARRRRPDREASGAPSARQVAMPASRSFPSGHAAAAAAFATGAGQAMPAVSLPLHALAAAVAYSRVHTGVHYPGDVVGGALLGAVIANLVGPRVQRRLPRAR